MIRVKHEKFGERVVRDDQRAVYEADPGWKVLAEVAPPEVDASMKQVLADVGDDPVAARSALEAEQSRSNPRTSLVTALVRIAEPDTKEN